LTQYRLAEGLPRVAGFSEDDSTWAGRVVDRLVNRAEVVAIEGESYRVKEARERAEQRTKKRSAARMEKKKS
jgi:DNA replication protein DnaC